MGGRSARRQGDGWATLDGTVSFVEHGAIATHFLVATGKGEIAIVPREAAGLAIDATPGLNVPPCRSCASRGWTRSSVTTSFDVGTLTP